MQKPLIALAVAFTAWLSSLSAAPLAPRTTLQSFPAKDVRLLPGSPFATAMEANRTYLLALDPDRLLAPFRREAGLSKKADSYRDWESIGLDGHTAGHYLSALSTMVVATGDAELTRRLRYMVSELAECQKASADGYVGGIPGSAALWAEIRKGNVDFVSKRWVPWYNEHKLFAGLRDAWLLTNNEQARTVLVRLADWCDQLVKGLTDDQMERMLRIEFGGMNEVLADVAAITGDTKYLTLAQRFSHRAILDPLAKGEDRLQGLHANTQVPKIIGYERVATLGGGDRYHAAADFFWHTVTQNRSVAFGGNSVSEHFRSFKEMLDHREGPETCNTYNMLRLTRDLFLDHPAAEYADYYERALYNHILASFNVQHPGYVYFTPIRPGHYRVYSEPGVSFWCCVGTGMENPGRYTEFIYARDPKTRGVYVNLFLPSSARWPEQGLVIEQQNNFPDTPRTRLALKLDRPADFPLHIRYPEWVTSGALRITVNQQPQTLNAQPGSYVELRRTWKTGDIVEVELPMHASVERLPEKAVSDYAAILYGPIVLAAPVGTDNMKGLRADGDRSAQIPRGPFMPQADLPVIAATAEDLPKSLQPVTGEPLTFTLGSALYPQKWSGLKLVPFFRLQETRYMVYWKLTTPEAVAASRGQTEAEDANRAAREAATLDRVAIGEQQSEADHRIQSDNSRTGNSLDRIWRDGRRFSYQLQAKPGVPTALLVTYFGGDRRDFAITINGQPFADVKLSGDKKTFIDQRYPIPESIVNAAPSGLLTVEFSAAPGKVAGGVFGLALMKADYVPATEQLPSR